MSDCSAAWCEENPGAASLEIERLRSALDDCGYPLGEIDALMATNAKLRALFDKLVIAVGHVEGISDERDSVPLLLALREIINAAFTNEKKP